MAFILQIDFAFEGAFGETMASEFAELAESINHEKGFIMKLWTENSKTKEAGGIYLFKTEEDAEKYLKMHLKRLSGFGVQQPNAKIFKVNEGLSHINHGLNGYA